MRKITRVVARTTQKLNVLGHHSVHHLMTIKWRSKWYCVLLCALLLSFFTTRSEKYKSTNKQQQTTMTSQGWKAMRELGRQETKSQLEDDDRVQNII